MMKLRITIQTLKMGMFLKL